MNPTAITTTRQINYQRRLTAIVQCLVIELGESQILPHRRSPRRPLRNQDFIKSKFCLADILPALEQPRRLFTLNLIPIP